MNNDDILKAARARMAEAVDFDQDNREQALDDMEFIAGRQWPEKIREQREAEGKAVITVNRLPQFVRQVTGDIRRLNPAIKVTAGDNAASDEGAEIYEGLIRSIEYKCDASSIYEGAAESAAMCGMGAFRVLAEYESEDSFDQVLTIKRIHNPFAVYWDPAARESTRSDAQYCFITDQIREDVFKETYADKLAESVEFDGQTDGLEYWHHEGSVVVAEYIWKEPVKKTIGILRSGEIVENPNSAMDLLKKRTVTSHKVMWAKISGQQVLEGPRELPCKYIPVIAVHGEEVHVGDEIVRSSVIRYAKDPQRLYNYWKSTHAELVALQPKAPYMVTLKQISGLEDIWAQANIENRAYLVYNPDEKAPPPQRATPPLPSAGIMTEAQNAAEDMKATTGIYDSALGQKSNETSGVAIRQRQLEGDIATSIYADNLGKAIAHCGRILVDMIPKVYDAERVIRIIGNDEVEKAIPVNKMQIGPNMEPITLNPLHVGKYDVRVSVGPSYSTRRQETAESMMQFIQAMPQVGAIAGDLLVKAMDWPDADMLAERIAKTLPPGMVEPDQMDPQAQLAIQQGMQQQQQAMQAEQMARQIEMQKNKAEADEALADARKAQFEAQKAELELALMRQQASMVQPIMPQQ